MAPRAKGTAGVHPNHLTVGVLGGQLQPGRKDQEALADRIRFPVLLPAQAPVLVVLLEPMDGRQGQPKGVREGLEGLLELLAFALRPIGGR